MEPDAVETGPGNADHGRDLPQHIRAGRKEVEMIGVVDHVIFGRGRQCDAHGLGIIRMRQDVILASAPELDRDRTSFMPSRPKVYPRAGAATTAALMRESCTQVEAGNFERNIAIASGLAPLRLATCAS